MDTQPYKIWPEVPVMFEDCLSLHDMLKHRIRRALEKLDDCGIICNASDREIVADVMYSKLVDLPELARAVFQRREDQEF